MFPFFKVITICFVRNILKNSYRRTLKPFCTLMITVTNTTESKRIRTQGKSCSQEVHSSLSHSKIAFPFDKLPLSNLESFLVFKLAEKRRICARVSNAA